MQRIKIQLIYFLKVGLKFEKYKIQINLNFILPFEVEKHFFRFLIKNFFMNNSSVYIF